MLEKPLQIPIRLAGRLMGMDDENTAYRNIPALFMTIRAGRHILVPVAQIANKLGCSFDHVWQAVAALKEAEKANEPARLAAEAAKAAEKERLRLAAIDRHYPDVPAAQPAKVAA